MSQSDIFDLFIVGGGINGAGIAADAAGRGLRVALAEMSDLASATSQASSKLIHGGLRYLEYYEFRLVHEALAEREVLLRKAPHLIWPLRFVLPHVPGVRPRWMIRAGLFLYDHLARRDRIPGSTGLDLAHDPAGRPLKAEFAKGFAYWDCWVDDARLVVLNAKAARGLGAQIMTHTRVVAAQPGPLWRITVEDAKGRREISARALINAAGPWVDGIDRIASSPGRVPNSGHVRLVKGSHLVVPRIAGAEDAYLMQNRDKRVVFVLPFEENFTIIGTTDVSYDGDPAVVAASAEEEAYLLSLANAFFKTPITHEDVLWRYSGVRPLYDDASGDPSAITRDYHLQLDATAGAAPRLSIYGGKVTTYRKLAEEALSKLAPHMGGKMGPSWTANAPLPGGDLANADFAAFLSSLTSRYPGIDGHLLLQFARRHGSLVHDVVGDARTLGDLGRSLGYGLYEREVRYMQEQEWVTSADDILWRRTKIGLHALADGGAKLSALRTAVAALL